MTLMTYNLLLISGGVVQILLLFGKEILRLKFALVLLLVALFSSIAFVPFNDYGSSEYLRVLVFLLLFSGFSSLIFREQVLPKVDEGSVFLWMILLWLVNVSLVSGFSFEFAYAKLFLGLTVLFTLLIMIPHKLQWLERSFLYAWYLFCLIWGIYHTSIFTLISGGDFFQVVQAISAYELFINGMLFSFFFVHLASLLYLLPIPYLDENMFEGFRRMTDQLNFFATKYSSVQSHPLLLASLGFFLVLAFALNQNLGIMNTETLLILFMLFIPFVSSWTLFSKT